MSEIEIIPHITNVMSDLSLDDLPDKLYDLVKNFYSGGFDNMFAFMGRQAGKNLLIAAMALYEVERLRHTSDPHKTLGIKAGKPINIFVVCNSPDQLSILFKKIKDIVLSEQCNLHNHVSKIEGTSIYFNSSENIRLVCTTCNSEEFRGEVFYCIFMNELRSFDNAEKFFNDVLMSVNSFNRVTDFKPHYVVLTSSDDEDSYIENIVKEIQDTNTIISRWPTWSLNETYSQTELRRQNKYMTKEDFDCEFGCIPRKPKMTTISMRVPVRYLEDLKKQARERSFNENKDITYADLIRESIAEISDVI